MDAVDGRQARATPGADAARAARAAGAPRRGAALDRTPPGADARAAPTSRPTTRSRRRRSGATASSRASPLADYAALPRRAGDCSWASGASSAARGEDGPSYEELVETEGRPRLRMWLDRIQTEGLLEAAVVYGYFPCVSEGDDLVVLHDEGERRAGAVPVHLPAPAPRPAPVPGRLLPAARRVRARSTWSRFTLGHDGQRRSRGDRGAVRRPTPTATTSSCTGCPCS